MVVRSWKLNEKEASVNFLFLKKVTNFRNFFLVEQVKQLLLPRKQFFDVKFFLATILLLPISLIILYLLGYIVACNGFFMTQINGITLNYGLLLSFLSGKFFPLGLIFENFYLYLLNPFAFTFYHPMQIYLGKYSPLETLWVFLGGIFWCFFLYFLAKLVFKMGLKKNESVGL